MWLVKNNIDSHSIEWELIMFINIRLLRLRSMDWKSSLSYHKLLDLNTITFLVPLNKMGTKRLLFFCSLKTDYVRSQ